MSLVRLCGILPLHRPPENSPCLYYNEGLLSLGNQGDVTLAM